MNRDHHCRQQCTQEGRERDEHTNRVSCGGANTQNCTDDAAQNCGDQTGDDTDEPDAAQDSPEGALRQRPGTLHGIDRAESLKDDCTGSECELHGQETGDHDQSNDHEEDDRKGSTNACTRRIVATSRSCVNNHKDEGDHEDQQDYHDRHEFNDADEKGCQKNRDEARRETVPCVRGRRLTSEDCIPHRQCKHAREECSCEQGKPACYEGTHAVAQRVDQIVGISGGQCARQ